MTTAPGLRAAQDAARQLLADVDSRWNEGGFHAALIYLAEAHPYIAVELIQRVDSETAGLRQAYLNHASTAATPDARRPWLREANRLGRTLGMPDVTPDQLP